MSGSGQFELILSTGRTIALPEGAHLSAQDVTGHAGAAFGEVAANPNDRSVLGLKNLTAAPWTAVLADGAPRQIDPGRSLRLAAGTRVNFGPAYGEIKQLSARMQSWKPASAVPGNSYITRHWRGELSLPMSYWVNGGVFGLIWHVALYEFSSTLSAMQIPGLSILVLAFVVVTTLALSIWTFVGIWRAAGRYRGARIWAILARIVVVIGWITLVGTVASNIWFYFNPLDL